MEMQLQEGDRVEVRGDSSKPWRQGTVVGRRANGKWEVQIDGWDKAYTWPEMRLPGGGPPAGGDRTQEEAKVASVSSSGKKKAPLGFVSGGTEDATPDPPPAKKARTDESSDDDDLFAPGVRKPFAAGRGKGRGKRPENRKLNGKEPVPVAQMVKKDTPSEASGTLLSLNRGTGPRPKSRPAVAALNLLARAPPSNACDENWSSDGNQAPTTAEESDDREDGSNASNSWTATDVDADGAASALSWGDNQSERTIWSDAGADDGNGGDVWAPSDEGVNTSWSRDSDWNAPTSALDASSEPNARQTTDANGDWNASQPQIQDDDWEDVSGVPWDSEQQQDDVYSWGDTGSDSYSQQAVEEDWNRQLDEEGLAELQAPAFAKSSGLPSVPAFATAVPTFPPLPPGMVSAGMVPPPPPSGPGDWCVSSYPSMVPPIGGTPGAPRQRPHIPDGNCVPQRGDLSVLLVAEKPAIALAFAQALAPNGKFEKERESGKRTLPSFTFTGPWVAEDGPGPPGIHSGIKCHYRATSTVGHMYKLDFPPQGRNWNRIDPGQLFDLDPVQLEADAEAQVSRHLADEASRCHIVILCLDCDREGEAIGYECLDTILPNLAEHPHIAAPPPPENEGRPWSNISAGCDFADDPRVWRARFSALAQDDLRDAMRSLQKPNPLEARSVDARSEIDLKVGVALSRLLTRGIQSEVTDLAPQREEDSKHGALISYGPCQTPTLGFCVQRWDEIQRFRKESAHTLDMSVKTMSGNTCMLTWEPPPELQAHASGTGRFRKKACVQRDVLDEFVNRAVSEAAVPGGVVETVCISKDARKRSVERPLALNTVELLKACSRELGMDPNRAMAVAEKLYLAGFLTYPRTETTHYPPSFSENIKEVLSEHAGHAKWGPWCRHLLGGALRQPRKGVNVGDHPPITPVRCATDKELKAAAGGMGRDAARVYELVVNWFLASFSPDVKYNEHEVIFDLGGFRFALRGNEVTDWGFMRISRTACMASPAASAVYSCNLLKQAARLELVQQVIPGTKLEVSALDVREVKSKPPPLLTEAELVSMMEKNGIGTDASISQHVSNVVARGYVEVLKPDRHMRPTILGVALVHGLAAIDGELTRPAVRARIERDVADVAKGTRRCEEVVAEALHIFREKFFLVRQGIPAMIQKVHSTKEDRHVWDGTAKEDEEAKEQPAEDEEEVVEAAPPLPELEKPAHKKKPKERSMAPAAADSQPLAKGERRTSSVPKASISRELTFNIPDVPALPEDASLEQVKAENDTLRKMLQVAKLKIEGALLRAENLEIRFHELERKYTVAEEKLSKLRPPEDWGSGKIAKGRDGKGSSKDGKGSKDSDGAKSSGKAGWKDSPGSTPVDKQKSSWKDKHNGKQSKEVEKPAGSPIGVPPPPEHGRKRPRSGGPELAPKLPYAEGVDARPALDQICWDFQRGRCPKGTKCRWSHASSTRDE